MTTKQFIINAARKAKREGMPIDCPIGQFTKKSHREIFQEEYKRFSPRKTK